MMLSNTPYLPVEAVVGAPLASTAWGLGLPPWASETLGSCKGGPFWPEGLALAAFCPCATRLIHLLVISPAQASTALSTCSETPAHTMKNSHGKDGIPRYTLLQWLRSLGCAQAAHQTNDYNQHDVWFYIKSCTKVTSMRRN